MSRPCSTHQKPTSILGSRQTGFSLLEVMIVVIIIGVLVSIFTLSVGSFSDDQTGEQVRRLEALIDLAAEEAIMQGRELGMRFYQHGYEFSARVPDVDEDGLSIWTWTAIEEDRLLKPRKFEDEITIELLIEGKEVDLDYDQDDAEEEDVYAPQIFILSSGDLAPEFSLRIRTDFSDQDILITVDAEGNTEISNDEF
jgi:general secretion pathway protein H